MARFGRGQPHGPIFVRAPLIAAVVAVATVSPIHIVNQATNRSRNVVERRDAVVYVRPSVTSLVPDRLPRQIHVVSPANARTPNVAERRTAFTYLRPPVSSVVPDRPLQQIHVVSLAVDRERLPVLRRAAVVYVRPSVTSLVPDQITPQIHVLARPRNRLVTPVHVTLLRNPQPALLTPASHVISLATERFRPERRAAILFVRPSVTSLVPDRIPPQIHVLVQPRHQQVPAVHVQYLRNPAPGFLSALAPPNHVVSLATERFRPERRAAIIFLRPSVSSLVPDRLAPQIHVVGAPRLVGPHRGAAIFLRTPVAPAAIATQAAPQIHVLLQHRRTSEARGHVQFIRTPLVPLGAPSRRLVSLVLGRGQLPTERRAAIIYLRPPIGSVVPDRLPVRIHVVGMPARRGRSDRESMVVVSRTALLPPTYTFLVVKFLDASLPGFVLADASLPGFALLDQSTTPELLDASGPAHDVGDQSSPGTSLTDESLP